MKWSAANDTPASASEFVQFANEVEEYAYESGDERSRVIVHCLLVNYFTIKILGDSKKPVLYFAKNTNKQTNNKAYININKLIER